MMATTHALGALALVAPLAAVAPELAVVVAVAAIVGGLFPDLDLYAGHRRTLHFPVYYWLLAVPAAAVAWIVPVPETVAVAVFLFAAALHSAMDAFGGGLELKPWLETSDRAVYSHYHGRWIEPRRWVRYDGAPEDLVLAVALAVPSLAVFDGVVRSVVLGLLAISAGYALVRKPLVAVAEWILVCVPDPVLDRLPERLLPIEASDLERIDDDSR
ncbi:metal-dependent hydrolase [Natrarchaeobius oligotrophus]|uniref:Metal-dependent hydrolase n=1 Tax=Natrarchaeobius chitinivorans TaxID=1679083 RepID=A0A3N6MGW2_NATCH|nr:metal-dependent hydrolase [Natrarchaeobius chitinivorans]RQH03334.1 metal-dependent hydrolase [Natrarchaeobius chitinivorans]